MSGVVRTIFAMKDPTGRAMGLVELADGGFGITVEGELRPDFFFPADRVEQSVTTFLRVCRDKRLSRQA